MFLRFIKFLNTVFASVNLFNKEIDCYKNITKEPSMPSYAYINWGLYLINNGKKEQGLEKLKQSAIMNSSNPELYISLGILYAQEGNFEEALKNFKKTVKLDKDNAKAWGYLANAYSELNETALAKSAYDYAIKLDKANSLTYLNYGIFCIKTNQRERAKTLFKHSYILNPMNIQALLMWGMVLVEENEYKGALTRFKKILTIEPFNPEALHMCGYCSMKLGQYQECIDFCKKSISLNSKKNENYLLIAESYLNLDDKTNCLNAFESYETFSSTDWKYYNSWGTALQRFNMWQESIEKFNKALELKNDEYIIYNSLSYSYLMLENYDCAKTNIEKLMSIKPEYAPAQYNLAQLYMKQNEFLKAIDCYKKAVSLDTSFKKVYFNIAGCYHLLNDTKNAIKYWEKSIDYDKNNKDAYLNLAMTYLNELQDYTKAIRYARSAYVLDKKDSETLYKYGIILLKSGDVHRALEKFEQAYSFDNGMTKAQISIAQCYLKLNQAKKALEILNKYNDLCENDEEYLLLKLVTLSEIEKTEKNKELIDTILQICDKIQTNFGKTTLVEEIKQLYK